MKAPETSENPFGVWLKKKRQAKNITVRQLADRSQVCSSSYISQLENNTYVGKSGNAARPRENVVVGLARALNVDENEALRAAGYATREEKQETEKPRNFSEFAAALEEMGVFDLQMFGGEEVFDNFTEFDYELFLEKMRNDVLHEVKRKGAAK